MENSARPATQEAVFEDINQHLGHDLLWALLATVGVAFICRTTESCQRQLRLVACLNNNTQRYFWITAGYWCWLKYHIFYAPVLRSKHSSLQIWGRVLTRFQALLLTTVIAANTVLGFYNVPYRDPEVDVLGVLRACTGTLAVANLIPIIVMASFRNPLIKILNTSYDSFNFMHRWFGRIAIVEAAIHTCCHIDSVVQQKGWSPFTKSVSEPTIWTGLVAMSALIAMLAGSSSMVRRAYYEAFHHLHISLAILVTVFLWMHIDGYRQQNLLLAAVILWLVSRFLRLSTLLYRSTGRTSCTAVAEALPGNLTRLNIYPSRACTYKPGQYIYLTIPSIGLWTAHPFSIAWSDTAEAGFTHQGSLKSQMTEVDDIEKAIESPSRQTFSLVVRARDDFTQRLRSHTVKHAPAHLKHCVPMCALVEGTYGLSRSLDSFGTVLLIAGGVGITHHLGHVRHLLQGYSQGTVAMRKVTLVWAVRRLTEKEMVGTWMDEILSMEGRRGVFRLEVWVTRGAVSGSGSASTSVVVRSGRPDLQEIVRRESQWRLGAMAVSVCGPAGMQDNARRAVRWCVGEQRNVEFMEEAFGW